MQQDRLPQVRVQLEASATCLYGLQTRRNQQEIEIHLRTLLAETEALRPGQRAELIILEEGLVSYATAEVTSNLSHLTMTLCTPVQSVWRRKSARISCQIRVNIRGWEAMDTGSPWLEVTTLDISAGGMCVYAKEENIPEQIELRLRVPSLKENPAHNAFIHARASVVRRKRLALGGMEMGLRFDEIDAESLERLRAYLENPQ